MGKEHSAPYAGRHQTVPAAHRPARPAGAGRQSTSEIRHMAAAAENSVDRKALYEHFVPFIERAHERNLHALKAGVWLLVLLPVILVIIQTLTGSNRIAFLIIWIFGMFAIATVLIVTAYSDSDLKKTLNVLKEIVPPEEDIEIGNLLPVDAEGEGWLIDPQDLPIPITPVLSEKLPQAAEHLREKRQERKATAGRTEKEKETENAAPDGKKKQERRGGAHAEHLENH